MTYTVKNVRDMVEYHVFHIASVANHFRVIGFLLEGEGVLLLLSARNSTEFSEADNSKTTKL